MSRNRVPAAVKLQNWLRENGLAVTDMARTLRTTRSTVYQWLEGTARPREPMRMAIERLTRGDVQSVDWLRAKERAEYAWAEKVVPHPTRAA